MQDDPFTGPAPKEVPLPNTPLAWVVAQVRFSSILSVERPDFVAPFQEDIRAIYPIARSEKTQPRVIAEPQQVSFNESKVVWHFGDAEDKWRVSIASDFLTLTTRAYESRQDFIDRLQSVLERFDKHIIRSTPPFVYRLGLRYVDHITGDAFKKLPTLIRPEVAGIMGTLAATRVEEHLSQTLFELPDNQHEKIQARWGQLPAGTTFDPNIIEPEDAPSWILDTDVFSAAQRSFDSNQLIGGVRRYAESIYKFFRWVVTDEFLRHYGGKP